MKELLWIFLIIAQAKAHSDGAPEEACVHFRPNHENAQEDTEVLFDLSFPNSFQGGKVVATAEKGKILKLTIKPKRNHAEEKFMGFLVQGRYLSNDEPVGVFLLKDSKYAQHLLCDESAPESTVTHTDSEPKETIELFWKPPPSAPPTAEFYFHYTIVKDYGINWNGRTSVNFSFE